MIEKDNIRYTAEFRHVSQKLRIVVDDIFARLHNNIHVFVGDLKNFKERCSISLVCDLFYDL